MYVSRRQIETLRATVPLERVVSDYTVLQYGGPGKLKGLCPFHTEKTPSFYVFTNYNSYRCFGCCVSGDIFKILMEQEGISFTSAVSLVEVYMLFSNLERFTSSPENQ